MASLLIACSGRSNAPGDAAGGTGGAGGTPMANVGGSAGNMPQVAGAASGGAGGASVAGDSARGGADAAGADNAGAADAGESGSGPCDAGLTLCGAACNDVTRDGSNCGSCGHDCLGGACTAGVCQPVLLVDNLDNPSALAVNADSLFFTDASGVESAPLAGGMPKSLYQGAAKLVAADQNYVYSATNEELEIRRIPLSGGTTTDIVGVPNVLALAVYADYVYEANLNGDICRVSPTDGTMTMVALIGLSEIEGLAVNAGGIFFRDSGYVEEIPLNGLQGGGSGGSGGDSGSGQNRGRVSVDGDGPIALDGQAVYISALGTMLKAPVSKFGQSGMAPFTQVAPGLTQSWGGIAVDARAIYWVGRKLDSTGTNWTGAIYRSAK